MRVVEIEETFDWEGNIIDASYTLGNEGIAARYKSQQYNTLSDFRDIQNGKKTLEFNWLPEAIKRASDIINGNLDSHFEYHAGEIIGINKSNPNGYMRFNTDGIGFSRDGGKTYRSAMTYEGIVADAITTGTLRAILIEAVEIYGSYIEGGEIKQVSSNREIIIKNGKISTFDVDGILRSEVSDTGNHYYSGNDYVGEIGSTRWRNDENYKGLAFHLMPDADYMIWSQKPDDNYEGYEPLFSWHRTSDKADKGFTFDDDVTFNDNVYLKERDLNFIEGAKIRKNPNVLRIMFDENTYISINNNGVVAFVHNGNVYESFHPS